MYAEIGCSKFYKNSDLAKTSQVFAGGKKNTTIITNLKAGK